MTLTRAQLEALSEQNVQCCGRCGVFTLASKMVDTGAMKTCYLCGERHTWSKEAATAIAGGNKERWELKVIVKKLGGEVDELKKKVAFLNDENEELRKICGDRFEECETDREKGVGRFEKERQEVLEQIERAKRMEEELERDKAHLMEEFKMMKVKRRELEEKMDELGEKGAGEQGERIQMMEKKIEWLEEEKTSKCARALVIGDSNVGRMRRTIQEMLGAEKRVDILSSDDGEVEEMVKEVGQWLRKVKGERMVVVHGGVKELMRNGEDGQKVRKRIVEGMRGLVELCVSEGARLLVCTLPLVEVNNGECREVVKQVNNDLREVVVGVKVELLSLDYVSDNKRNMHVDGFHYGVKGQSAVGRPIVRRMGRFFGVSVERNFWVRQRENVEGPMRTQEDQKEGSPVEEMLKVVAEWVLKGIQTRK